jgi:hypothetical protein
VKAIKAELKKRMHAPIKEVGSWLKSVVTGHYQYYGVPGNYEAMNDFRYLVYWHWRRVLTRRSQKGQINWARMNRIINRWLPRPRICQQHPLARIGVNTQGRSPVR